MINVVEQVFTNYVKHKGIIGMSHRNIGSMTPKKYYDLIVKNDSLRNLLRKSGDYNDNFKEVKQMWAKGKLKSAYYAPDVDMEYMMKIADDNTDVFNLRTFPNLLRAFANYENQEYHGVSKLYGYFGSFGSSSPIHNEIWHTNSLNVLIYGADKIWKVWTSGKCYLQLTYTYELNKFYLYKILKLFTISILYT